MKVGLYQCRCTPGDHESNIRKVLDGLRQADEAGIQILAFPECFLTGYQNNEAAVRASAWRADGPEMAAFIERTAEFNATLIVGFNELRDGDLYNTAIVLERGRRLGTYSKCTAYMPFHKQGRDFPVFESKGLTFGVVLCSDGGYIEPTRILALKGAKAVFAPHFNYIEPAILIDHFQAVRADHTARARENSIYFVRANSVGEGRDPGMDFEGVGYGDSYIIDPMGEMVTRSRRGRECLVYADIDPEAYPDPSWGVWRSLYSAREFGEQLRRAVESRGTEAGPGA